MILDYLRAKGNSVGQTTVYRNLDKLVKDGVVFKLPAPDGLCAWYQYLEQPEDRLNHYHLVCTKCGHIVHLNCKHIAEFTMHIHEKHHFNLDSLQPILYGRCESCIVK